MDVVLLQTPPSFECNDEFAEDDYDYSETELSELAGRLVGLADGAERVFWLFDTDEMCENTGALASRLA